MTLFASIYVWQPHPKRSYARNAAETPGGVGATADAPARAAQMIFEVAALPLLPMVWAPNLHRKVVTRVVPISIDTMGFIPNDATHVSSYLPLLLWCL